MIRTGLAGSWFGLFFASLFHPLAGAVELQDDRVMHQPVEDSAVSISRAAGTVTFPSRFMFVAAMNPCKCGYYGDSKRKCRCAVREIENYRQRISGPLLDRIEA